MFVHLIFADQIKVLFVCNDLKYLVLVYYLIWKYPVTQYWWSCVDQRELRNIENISLVWNFYDPMLGVLAITNLYYFDVLVTVLKNLWFLQIPKLKKHFYKMCLLTKESRFSKCLGKYPCADANSKTFIQGPVCFQGIWSRIYLIIMWA